MYHAYFTDRHEQDVMVEWLRQNIELFDVEDDDSVSPSKVITKKST